MSDKTENEPEYKAVHCRSCNRELYGKNARDVGYCLDCFAIMMSDDEEEDEEYNQQQKP